MGSDGSDASLASRDLRTEASWTLNGAWRREPELRPSWATRAIAVVGFSSKPCRPSLGVAAYLQEHGYRIVPVNPHETEVLGERAYPTRLDDP